MKIFARRLAFVGILLLAAMAWADTLELKNGQTYQGKYLGGTDSEIDFQIEGKVQRFAVGDVLVLNFGPATKTASLTSTQPAAPVVPQTMQVPAGTPLVIRMIDGVDSSRNKVGDHFSASLEQDLVIDGVTVAPKGADVMGQLAEAKEAGHFAGHSELKLQLTTIRVNQTEYPITTADYELAGKGRGSNTAKKVGGGAAAGALIGALVGGGKGAAIGAGVGAGAGATVQVLTHGEQVKVPSETVLSFRLQDAATLPVSKSRAQ